MSALGPRIPQGGRRTGGMVKDAEASALTSLLPEGGLSGTKTSESPFFNPQSQLLREI